MRTTIVREDDRVWLEGVSGWFVGDWESSVHAAQATIMGAAGYETTYAYLVGVSGLGFRAQVHQELCPSSPHSFCGYACHKRSAQAAPLAVHVYEAKADDAARVAEARRAVMASIDRGIPVQYGSEEDGVIVGYQAGGGEWICYHPLHKGGTERFVDKEWPWGIAIYGPDTQKPSRRALAIEALQQAIEMDRTERVEDYWLGERAWIEYLAVLEGLLTSDERTRHDLQHGNAWIYECLAQYRDCAARFLRDSLGDLPEAAESLERAAALYDRMANQVLRDDEQCTVTVAPYPGSPTSAAPWTRELIEGQIARLREAQALERQAIAAIGSALQTLGHRLPTDA